MLDLFIIQKPLTCIWGSQELFQRDIVNGLGFLQWGDLGCQCNGTFSYQVIHFNDAYLLYQLEFNNMYTGLLLDSSNYCQYGIFTFSRL